MQRFKKLYDGADVEKVKSIIWDECTKAHKRSLKSLDRTMRDVLETMNNWTWQSWTKTKINEKKKSTIVLKSIY